MKDWDDAFWGIGGRLTDPGSLKCKGTLFGSRRRYVKARYGQDMVDEIAGGLSGDALRLFSQPPLPFTWYAAEHLYAIDEVIFTQAMGRDEAQMKAFGAEIAATDLNAVYRAFFRLGKPSFFLARTHLIWSQYFSHGTAKGSTEAKEARIELLDVVIPRYLCEFGLGGYIHEATRSSGGRQIEVTHPRCVHRGDPHCMHHVRWT